MTIAVVFTVSVALLWSALSRVDDTGISFAPLPVTPTVLTTAIVPTTAATPSSMVATPDIVPEWPAGSLPALLDLAPDRLADGSLPLRDIATYADVARWITARGVVSPTSRDGAAFADWNAEIALLALPDTLRANGLDPSWEAAYGFNLFAVDQVLQIGQAPDFVLIMRGAFDPDTLQAAWVASGYQPVEIQGTTTWTLNPDDTIDLSAAASRPAMGSLNNIVLLDDGTLVAAARISRMEDTLRVIRGKSASLARNEALAGLLAPGSGADRLATAILSRGSWLQDRPGLAAANDATPIASTPIATPDLEGIPEVEAVLIGLPLPESTGADLSPADVAPRLTAIFGMRDVDAAIQARNWITAYYPELRFPLTGEPYSVRLGDLALLVVESDRGPAGLVITASLQRGWPDWLAIIAARDFGFTT